MAYYRVTFTTSKGYKHTDSFKDWQQARVAYALALRTHGEGVTFTHCYA